MLLFHCFDWRVKTCLSTSIGINVMCSLLVHNNQLYQLMWQVDYLILERGCTLRVFLISGLLRLFRFRPKIELIIKVCFELCHFRAISHHYEATVETWQAIQQASPKSSRRVTEWSQLCGCKNSCISLQIGFLADLKTIVCEFPILRTQMAFTIAALPFFLGKNDGTDPLP